MPTPDPFDPFISFPKKDSATHRLLNNAGVNSPTSYVGISAGVIAEQHRELSRILMENGTKQKLLRKELTGLEAMSLFYGETTITGVKESLVHQVIAAVMNDDVTPFDLTNKVGIANKGDWGRNTQSILLQHDWAKALGGLEIDQFKLPFEQCCFEFYLNGVRTCLIFDEGDNDGAVADDKYAMSFFFKFGDEWGLVGPFLRKQGKWVLHWDDGVVSASVGSDLFEQFKVNPPPLVGKMFEQIKALCVALDAQVVDKEVLRVPLGVNQRRIAKGKPPIRNAYVLKIKERRSYMVQPGEAEKGTKRRLHFRRGHWRHYSDHKTWINWMLVGDPNLGFINKSYSI